MNCVGSGERVTGCVWVEKRCSRCGLMFFATYDTGRWVLPPHEKTEKEKTDAS